MADESRTWRYWWKVYQGANTSFSEQHREALRNAALTITDELLPFWTRWMARRSVIRIIEAHPQQVYSFVTTWDYSWSTMIADSSIATAVRRHLAKGTSTRPE